MVVSQVAHVCRPYRQCRIYRGEGKLACFGKSDPNKRMNMEEREKGEGGSGTERYTAEER